MAEHNFPQSSWLRGLARAVPIIMGYIPIGFAYGVLAQKTGLSLLNTVLMSLLVYAGSAQFIAVGLISNQASVLSIIATAFVVNFRHFLMAASISPALRRWRRIELAAFAFELTDESFALHAMQQAELGQLAKVEALVINSVAQVTWILGSLLGAVAGQLIRDVKPFGLDYVLTAMFIGLLILQLKRLVQVWVAFISGLLAVLFMVIGWGQWSVITATLIGATVGVGLDRCHKNKS